MVNGQSLSSTVVLDHLLSVVKSQYADEVEGPSEDFFLYQRAGYNNTQ